MQHAQALCDKQNARLTPMRKQVLTLIWQSHKPLGAYDLIELVSSNGKRTAPPTIYRALEFLQNMGLIHRLATLNAFIGCAIHKDHQAGCFLICTHCHNVQELLADDATKLLREKVLASGFQVENTQIEISGQCAHCASEANADAPDSDAGIAS